jgi:hypothetical protein
VALRRWLSFVIVMQQQWANRSNLSLGALCGLTHQRQTSCGQSGADSKIVVVSAGGRGGTQTTTAECIISFHCTMSQQQLLEHTTRTRDMHIRDLGQTRPLNVQRRGGDTKAHHMVWEAKRQPTTAKCWVSSARLASAVNAQ